MIRAAFLDRDGTMIHDPGYLADPAGVALLDGTAAAVALLRRSGYAVVVVSNQSGVARGLYGAAGVAAVNQRMMDLLAAVEPEARIAAVYVCPHGPEEGCPCRKPRPGLLLRAALDLDIDLAGSLAVGDSSRDVEAALAAGIPAPRALQLGAPDSRPSLLAAIQHLLPQVSISRGGRTPGVIP
ncbi:MULTISPECIES: HAD-IIIA family hydrolase [Sorangium]|uniref:D,D-heptose 1,7-bisphosphate phosphatase n=1 Tax=Sorangium cellulosum TaxID=56 RepID=A0A4P2QVJ1_SORCE|nr:MULTISPECIES: HAD family hydrolase [Sorangium]AUX34188.1 D,D-heptose 1,7-bisphosphate phosphatase [Sorangium cellulosum]WCQ93501.1 D-glycero-beta-D-manno-heptose-1,7-bisphosphate 7-phosphatase [Sorangium sp. Soce836]